MPIAAGIRWVAHLWSRLVKRFAKPALPYDRYEAGRINQQIEELHRSGRNRRKL